ncbi:facilitated trehalose transporter Tret1-like [Cylas formicarius]|uniref:facilitated trehalose transporter Tret1-like n=1 Tax=Cylas formicarius TaxID=197179 RepID=UPI00295869AE|nr:facilitated trehalose transporter Tret1-like [Cylas formicarius]
MNQDNDALLEETDPKLPCIPTVYDNIDTQVSDIGNIDRYVDANRPKNTRQIIAGFSASLSALSAGLVLGWTSPILNDLVHGKYNNINIDDHQMGWIGSFVTLGAMTMCIPTGFICDLVGRKKALLLLLIPFALGWSLIVWAKNPIDLYFGRLITGMAVGACCIATPLYNGEIAHKTLRGALGSCFQLMITIGIFVSYLVGKYFSPFQFTVFCALLPLIFGLTFAFQPESPTHLIRRGQLEEAKKCLILLRGEHYNVDAELLEIEGSVKEDSEMTISFRNTFTKKSVWKAVLIAFALMFFQQFCGINAVVMYSSDIIKSTGVNLDANTATIMIGAFQAVATFCASVIIDKAGRKPLLTLSLSLVSLTALILAAYLTLKAKCASDSNLVRAVGFVPVGALCLFVVAFSLGLGPIPWMISSEILSAEIRSLVSSMAGTFNWFLAFILTKFYLELCRSVGEDTLFYAFSVFTLLGIIFIVFVVPETRGKSVSEIQEELER